MNNAHMNTKAATKADWQKHIWGNKTAKEIARLKAIAGKCFRAVKADNSEGIMWEMTAHGRRMAAKQVA